MESTFLQKRMAMAEEIVENLKDTYPYISIFGRHAQGKQYVVNSRISQVGEANSLTQNEAGFVIKVFHDGHYSEVSLDDLDHFDYEAFKRHIEVKNMNQEIVDVDILDDEPLVQDFVRKDEHPLSDEEIMAKLTELKDYFVNYDKRFVDVSCLLMYRQINSFFVSKKRKLSQYYNWLNCGASLLVSDGDKLKDNFELSGGNDTLKTIEDFMERKEEIAKITLKLLEATAIEPGVYEVVTDPSISGLIAHEAFGHGVEMDMFVKNRAKAKDYMGKKVASDLVNMHDGAAAVLSAASYFFDDDGVLANDTTIIENGILVNGLSDVLTALELKRKPSGNSRRESSRRKAYTRMTNTFFLPGKDKKEDIFKSIKHGYYLCNTNNGMEDPKNWQIQCTAQYGLEIKDGEFTGKIVSPVVMSGYVLDVLNSISMVSDEYKIIGSGMCGKGHKEWVFVADGGPYMKAKVKLG